MEQKSKIVNKKKSEFAQNWLTVKIYTRKITTSTVRNEPVVCQSNEALQNPKCYNNFFLLLLAVEYHVSLPEKNHNYFILIHDE